jgi:hypothetical protein
MGAYHTFLPPVISTRWSFIKINLKTDTGNYRLSGSFLRHFHQSENRIDRENVPAS